MSQSPANSEPDSKHDSGSNDPPAPGTPDPKEGRPALDGDPLPAQDNSLPETPRDHDRTAALADGLRHGHREGDISSKEYARQMQEITQEAD